MCVRERDRETERQRDREMMRDYNASFTLCNVLMCFVV